MSDVSDASPIDLNAIAEGIREPWQRVDVVPVNEASVRMAMAHGEFPWHEHQEDEFFLCWSGRFTIERKGHTRVSLEPGQVFVVPRGERHRPVAEEPAVALLIERPETKQYGE